MLKKLLTKKQNNKGFSLVELIVVVLIIAIIAVALAPQVMKWVGQGRNNVDNNNQANIKAAVQTVVADYQSTQNSLPGAVFNINGAAPAAADMGVYATLMNEIMNGDWPATQTVNTGFNVVITASSGAVTVTY